MKKISKSLLAFSLSMLLFVGLSFSQGVECTLQFGVYYEGWHAEYWCCSGPQGCFWDVYQEV